MSQDKQDQLLNHDSDGIKEYDNALPKWWLYLFYFTIIWGAIYAVYFHFTDHLSQRQQLDKELAEKKIAAPAESADANLDWDTLVTDSARLERGKAGFAGRCIPCHGAEGQGGIGPNLTDKFWIHGGKAADIQKTITEGVPDKGMVPWKTLLKKDEIIDLTVFVMSLKGTSPPNPKPPQGDPEK